MRRSVLAIALVVACSDAAPEPEQPPRDPADEVVAWLDQHGSADDASIGAMVGDAHVVAFGEATHGTREFPLLELRFLEHLVAEKGFTIFAIEANAAACGAIDDYVVHGRGDAVAALRGLGFWTLYTEEVLALIEWLRAWNADARHRDKVHFAGIDTRMKWASFEARDRAMAENVLQLRAGRPEGTRIVLWAHDGHVAFGGGVPNMGSRLRQALGTDYLAFGFLFGRGSFRAVSYADKGAGPVEHTMPPPSEGDASLVFARTRQPWLAVDLRELPARGAVHDWFHAPHPLRQSGAVFLASMATTVLALPEQFDAVVYVDQTTISRPLD